MKHHAHPIAACLILSCLVASPVLAQDYRYITDSLEVTMRAGNSTQHRITKMLRSGTKLEVLQIEAGWAEVTTPEGSQGWVLSRFLINQPVARDRLSQAEAQLTALTEGDAKLRSELVELQGLNDKLQDQNTRLTASNSQLDQELKELQAATADTVAVMRSNSLLKAQMTRLKNEVAEVSKENRDYRDNSAQAWFVRGAAVIFGGILLGLILPRIPLPRRKRSTWNSL